MSDLDTFSGIDFEKLIAQLLQRMGFRAEMTKATGDGGIDIEATLDHALTGGRFLIQCKRYAPGCLVGAAAVREFYGALTAEAPKITAGLEYIDRSLFQATPLIFATLIDMKPDKQGHASRLIVTRAEREQLVRSLQTSFGKKLDQQHQNLIVGRP